MTSCRSDAERGRGCPTDPATERASYVFLLFDDGRVHSLPHRHYVALSRGEAAAPAFAGQRCRLADWFVELRDGIPQRLLNEWYGWVGFDTAGRLDLHGDRHGAVPGRPDPTALPSGQERQAMHRQVFVARTGEGAPGAGCGGDDRPNDDDRPPDGTPSNRYAG